MTKLKLHNKQIAIAFKFIALLFLVTEARAQNICFDSSQINQYTFCGQTYEPVCGCNNQTYRNECLAVKRNGIVSYVSGICEPVAIEFNPNPVVNFMNLTLMRKEEGTVLVTIYDIYGKVHFSQYYYKVNRLDVKIETNELPHGMYIITAVTTRYGAVKKFLKQPQP